MAHCPGCGEPRSNTAAPCPICATLALPDEIIFEAQTNFDAGGSETMAEDEKRPESVNTGPLNAPPVLGEPIAGTGATDGGATGTIRAKTDTIQISRPTFDASPPPPPPPTAAAEYERRYAEEAKVFGTDAFNLKRLEALQNRKHPQTGEPAPVPIVLFLGMRTTGKTWLLQRMKKMLYEDFTCEPPFQLTEQQMSTEAVVAADEAAMGSEAALSTTMDAAAAGNKEARATTMDEAAAESRGATGGMIFHTFEPIKSGGGKLFVLVDVPGEYFRQLAENKFNEIRSLAAALKYAGTAIVALPADIALLAPRVHNAEFNNYDDVATVREDQKFVATLTESLAKISKLRSLLIQQNVAVRWKHPDGPDDDYDLEITPEKVNAHTWDTGRVPFGGEDGMGCPVYIALTKGDKFFAASDKLPDVKHNASELSAKFAAANMQLKGAPGGDLLTKLFQESDLNKKSLLEPRTWFSDIKLHSSEGVHIAPISNPPEMMMQSDRALFKRLMANFPMSRIDLVSAFYGHTGNTLCLADIENHPEIGIGQMTRWLGTVHDNGLNRYHRWARSVFARIYDTDAARTPAPTGGWTKKPHSWWLRGLSPRTFAALFRKEFHWVRVVPWAVLLIGAALLLLGSNSWWEKTDRYFDGGNYTQFLEELEAPEPQTPALQAVLGTTETKAANAVALQPLVGLTGWRRTPDNGPVFVDVNELRYAGDTALSKERLDWQDRYVCGLEDWAEYREIVRKAVINGYGECSGFTKIATRSPLIDSLQQWLGYWAGAALGIFFLILGLVLFVGGIVFRNWFVSTREAYGWLYHSHVATMTRPETNPTVETAQAAAAE